MIAIDVYLDCARGLKHLKFLDKARFKVLSQYRSFVSGNLPCFTSVMNSSGEPM